MLLRSLRFTRGYVRFEVSGRYPERFLNITARNGVRLWEVRRRGDGLSACMYRADYRRIRPLARGAGVILRLRDKYGLPHYASRYRDRAGILLGGCAFVLTVFVMSLFVWSVEVTGLQELSEAEMRAALRDQGLYVGAFLPPLDAVHIADQVMIEHSEVGWMAVNFSGSCASVEVKEKAQPPRVNDISRPCNIKASRDGMILSVEAGEGTTVVSEGSGVLRGQLLVSGVMENADGGSRLVHANARVMARTTREASFSVPEKLTQLTPTGEYSERYSAQLFGLRIPFTLGGVGTPYAILTQQTQAPAPLGVTLPVSLTRERVSAALPCEISLNDDSAEELLLDQAAIYEVFSLGGCEVEERQTSLKHTGGVYTLTVRYTCVEDIAREEPIEVGEIY